MKYIVILVLSSLAAACSGFLLDDLVRQEKWDGLKVTWGPNPLSSDYFVKMPRTVSDAVQQGFQKISDCDVNAKWRGARYVKNNDYAVILLFDVNGYIAGIQTSVPKGQTPTYPSTNIQPPFVEDGDRWVISAYFVQPSKICTAGRTAAEFDNQGTGTNLYLQNSSSPEASVMIPHQESGIGSTRWTEGKCFVTMGKHYWYDLRKDMSCDNMFPAFLLYNSGELTAFGWAMNTALTSKRFEHPSQSTFSLFMSEVPQCLYDVGTISTMHIYLTSSAAYDLC